MISPSMAKQGEALRGSPERQLAACGTVVVLAYVVTLKQCLKTGLTYLSEDRS